jgi:hypothetical protein
MSPYDRRRRGKLFLRAALHAENQTFVRFMVCVISGNHKSAPVHRIAKPRAVLAAASRRKTIAYPPQKPCSPATGNYNCDLAQMRKNRAAPDVFRKKYCRCSNIAM